MTSPATSTRRAALSLDIDPLPGHGISATCDRAALPNAPVGFDDQDFTRPMEVRTSSTRACSSLQELGELVAGQIGVVPALLLQDSFQAVDFTILSIVSVSAFAASAVMPGGATTERQLAISRSTPCSFSVARRCLGAGRRGHADQAQLAGLDLAFELAVAGNAGRDLAAEDRGERFAAAGERDVVDLGRVGPAALANSAAAMWSTPPAEPPAQVTLAGSALMAAARSLAVLIGELAGTTMASSSAVSRAIGVTWSRVTGDLLVRIAPTMTKPLTMSWLPSPLALLTNWAMPMVPPAPGTLVTCTLLAMPDCVRPAASSARSGPSRRPAPPAP